MNKFDLLLLAMEIATLTLQAFLTSCLIGTCSNIIILWHSSNFFLQSIILADKNDVFFQQNIQYENKNFSVLAKLKNDNKKKFLSM